MLATNQVEWSHAAEIIVVGFGAAGAVSGITAHDLGAEVLILEKQPANNHISTSHMSAGIFVCPSDVPAAITYMEHLTSANEGLYWTNREITQVWAEYMSQNKEWIEKLGGKVKLRVAWGEHNVPGQESIKSYYVLGLGRGLMRLLKGHVESRSIPVLYRTTADKLLTNTDGEVIGVRAQSEGKETHIRASRAVIMTTGGFEFDEEMKLNYLPVHPTYFAGSPANTGDGIRMAQEVGASLWHMNCCSASLMLKSPEFPIALGPNFNGSPGFARAGTPCGYIIVDKYGRRYTNEVFKRHTVYYELASFDSYSLEYPRVPSYWIFDQRRIKAGPLPLMYYGPMLYRLFKWSKDNSAELNKGWIIHGDTVEELAHQLKIAPSILRKTVQDYNAFCKQEEDPQFHRPPPSLVPLNEPPLFAVALWPGGPNTQGGPRRNQKGQILDTEGRPVPRLYGAGELGSVYGRLYPQAGGNIGECIAFGRIAGENAVTEQKLP